VKSPFNFERQASADALRERRHKDGERRHLKVDETARMKKAEQKAFDVVLASCVGLPEPDEDEAPLSNALRAAGVNARVMAWDDPLADFATAKMVVIRSTWNYCRAYEAFLRWVDETSAHSDLHNPAPVVHWNLHKKYLLDLGARGIPTIPTRIFSTGQDVSLAAVARELDATEIVIKPAVSAASSRTIRAEANSAAAQDHLRAILETDDVMIQPYVRSVEGYGERAIICIDGKLSHAVRKSPRFQGDRAIVSGAMPIADDEAALALNVLAAIPGPLLYARVDMVRDARNMPIVMEVELTEPSLFLVQSPSAFDRFVAAIAQRLK
jgi:hypothetical protein